MLFGKSLGTYLIACALEKKLVQPSKVVWLTPSLNNKWSTMTECGIHSFAIIGTADPRFAAALPHLPQDRLVVKHADHSLEIQDDVLKSIETLREVTAATSRWLD